MRTRNTIKLIALLWIGSCTLTLGQAGGTVKSMVSIESGNLIATTDNPIRIVAQQNEPVAMSQLRATFQVYDQEKKSISITDRNGFFIIHPDTIGVVELYITIGDTVETKLLKVKPIVAIGRLGRYKANTDATIDAHEFKTQFGISANVECCGFDAKCKVLGFQLIRISPQNQVERVVNRGGRFEKQAIAIVRGAASGDIFIFRQINYRCPATLQAQRLEDMIFEIK